jgi:4-hydroxy-tetrahydrodipicolinate synthase
LLSYTLFEEKSNCDSEIFFKTLFSCQKKHDIMTLFFCFMLRGTYTALITPFDQNGEVDKLTLREIIAQQIAAGVEGIVIAGTTGESPTLSHKEQIDIIGFAVDIAHGNTKVIAGTGSNSTQEAVYLTREAASVGADAALIAVPYYNKPSQEGLFQHFQKIASEVPQIPQILYDVPARTSVRLAPETILRLSRMPNIVSLKDATGDLKTLHALSGKLPEYFSFLSGNDDITLEYIQNGGQGVISVASNLYPIEIKNMVDAALSKNISAAQKLNDDLSSFFELCGLETNPIPIKTCMAIAEKCQEVFRLPLCPLSPENRDKVCRFFAQEED